MALLNCNVCGKPVSEKAVACPYCGAPIIGPQTTQTQYSRTQNGDTMAQPATRQPAYGGQPAPVGNNGSGGNKGMIYALLALVFVLVVALIVMMLKNTGNRGSDEVAAEAEQLAQIKSERDQLKKQQEETRIAEEQRQLEEQRQQIEAERMRAEAARRAAEEAARYRDASGTYRGKIKSSVVLNLTQSGSSLSGNIRYTKYNGGALELTGSIDNSGNFELYEYEGYEQTGQLTGRISGKYMTGSFYNPNRGATYQFTLTR